MGVLDDQSYPGVRSIGTITASGGVKAVVAVN